MRYKKGLKFINKELSIPGLVLSETAFGKTWTGLCPTTGWRLRTTPICWATNSTQKAAWTHTSGHVSGFKIYQTLIPGKWTHFAYTKLSLFPSERRLSLCWAGLLGWPWWRTRHLPRMDNDIKDSFQRSHRGCHRKVSPLTHISIL